MPKLNIELLAQIREHILAVPESYNQATFGSPEESAPCGTRCCIAGHALILAGKATPLEVAENMRADGSAILFEAEAAEVLGITPDDADILFDGSPGSFAWPEPFASRWGEAYDMPSDAQRQQARAQIAADYLAHIIETGKVTE